MTTEDALKSSISQHCQTVHSWDFAQWFLPLYGFHSLHIINRCTDLRRICPGPGRVLMVPWAKFGDDNTDGEWTTSMGVRQSQDPSHKNDSNAPCLNGESFEMNIGNSANTVAVG